MRDSLLATLAGAIALGLFIGYFTSGAAVVENLPTTAASSTGLSVLATTPLPVITLPAIGTTTATTSTPIKPKAATKPPTLATPAPTAPVITPAAPAQAPAGNIDTSASEIRGALVNILCEAPEGSSLESISGSGVVIDSRGIILTNAHIGQYFLLANRGVSCVIRTGSPAQDAYYASLAFISPAWLSANSAALTETAPTGTGEHDIALLVITHSASNTPLPSSFSYAPLAQNPPVLNEPVVIGSYAAQFLQTTAIEDDLFPTIVYGSIQAVFTFQTNTVDVVSLGGSAAAQEGSSGGGIVDASGELAATITTSTTQGATSDRELDAITASYIRRDYAAESGIALDTLLAEKTSDMVANFAPRIPALEGIITADLQN